MHFAYPLITPLSAFGKARDCLAAKEHKKRKKGTETPATPEFRFTKRKTAERKRNTTPLVFAVLPPLLSLRFIIPVSRQKFVFVII